jgi:hypothetical protein
VHCGPPGQVKKLSGGLIADRRSDTGLALGFLFVTASLIGLVFAVRRRRVMGH